MESRAALSVIVAAFLLPALAAGQGQVWVVAPGTGHPQIQAVVDAAQDGDTVLVKQGSYESFFIDDKALHVVAEAGATVTVRTPVHVEHLAPGKVVTLAGLLLKGPQAPTGATGLVVRNNAGALRVVDCRIEGSIGPSAQPGVRLLQSGDVAFVRCLVFGGWGNFTWEPAGQGVFSRRANVAMYDGLVFGGPGGSAKAGQYGDPGGHGAPSYECPEGLLFASNTNFTGGAGGSGGNENCDIFQPIGPGPGGNGGHGVLLGSLPPSGLVPQAFFLGGLQAGGIGGPGGGGFCFFPTAPSGSPGQPIVVNNGSFNILNDPVRSLQSPPLARELTQVPFSMVGVPGDAVYLMVSTTTQWVHEPTLAGVALVPNLLTTRGRFAGIVPASGTLTFSLKLGDLGPGVESRTLHMQALVYDSFGVRSLASFGVLAVVDQQF